MLDAYIIEEIKKEQQERERKYDEGRHIWQEIYIPPQLPRREKSEPEDQELPYKIEISLV